MKKNVEGKSFMDKKDLVKYLSYLKTMEESIYTLEATKSKLTQRINSLGFANTYTEPKMKESDLSLGGCVSFPFICGAVGIIPGIIFGYIAAVNGNSFLTPLIVTVIIAAFIGFIIGAVTMGMEDKKESEDYENAQMIYKQNVENDKLRVERELKEKNFLMGESKKIENQLSIVRHDLSEAYSIGVIFETYRNFCAVSSFYEYLASGVCDTLDGPDGAMRLYRNEVLQGRIIESLQKVISSLEDIKQNQYTLYEAIERGNVTSENLLKSSIQLGNQNEQIIRNTAIDAHNSEIARNDLNMLTWITAANSKW